MTNGTIAGSTTTPELLTLPIEQIKESPHNPRRHYDAKALQELTESIRAKGIIEPLLVRPVNNYFELIGGSRRLRAAKAAALKEVPALIRKGLSDSDAMEMMIIDNLQRDDVHPLDEAFGYEHLVDQYKKALTTKPTPGFMDEVMKKISARVGKSTSYVYQRLKLSELIEPAKKAFFDERITAGHAILIARLQPDMQEKALEACNVKVDLEARDERFDSRDVHDAPMVSVRGLTQWIQSNVHLNLKKAAFDIKDATLDLKAGACIVCPKRTGCSPTLFEDVSDKDTCTDPSCFHRKEKALVAREAEAAEKKLIPLSSTQVIPDEDRRKLPPDLKRNFKVVKEGSCEHARKGVVVYGPGVGDVKTICAAVRSCRKHHASTYLSPSVYSPTKQIDPAEIEAEERKEAARRKAQELKFEISEKILVSVIDAVTDKVKSPLLPALMLQRLAQYYDDCPDGSKYLPLFNKATGNLSALEAARRLTVALMNINISGDNKFGKFYLTMAKFYKVNVSAIEKEVTEKLTPKPDPRAKEPKKEKKVKPAKKGKKGK